MLRHLLLLACIAGATSAMAQKPTTAPTRMTEKPGAEIEYKEPGSRMPRLKVMLFQDSAKNAAAEKGKKKSEDKIYITSEDVANNANLFVMMFNPTCSHCEDEAAILRNNISLFKETNLILMANPGMKQYMPDFVHRQHLDEYPTFHIGIDSADFINKVYLFQMLPQINIYDHDRKLLKIFNGEVIIDSLKKYIE